MRLTRRTITLPRGISIEHDIMDIGEDVEDIEVEDQRLQRQIDRLEAIVFNGNRKPPLRPYAGD